MSSYRYGGSGGGDGGRSGGRSGGGQGRGNYYKNKYGRGGSARRDADESYESANRNDQNRLSFSSSQKYLGDSSKLEKLLQGSDRQSYPAYKSILGKWDFGDFLFYVDKIQADPFAPPSRFRVHVPHTVSLLPEESMSSKIRRIALADYLTREFQFNCNARRMDLAANGGGWHASKGGAINIEHPGQHILERTSCIIHDDHVEIRFTISLPAQGRSIEGYKAAQIICTDLPQLVRQSIMYDKLDKKGLKEHIISNEDQEFLRQVCLKEAGLIAFCANGAILPRKSGADDKSMSQNECIRFKSPESMEQTFKLPSGKVISGMAIRKGVCLIVGGGFHGKSTLLEAIQVGVYNHIPGDGREFVVTDPSSVKIRAEDGRCVNNVDISPFISNLPYKKDTTNFSSLDASGSTSQATNIMEALEMGSKVLIIDEDTCATNFMIRDSRMQELVSKDKEPITPFVARIRDLFENHGVSTILVVGGTGDYFDVADQVVMMDCYIPKDVTSEAKAIAYRYDAGKNAMASYKTSFFKLDQGRIPLANDFLEPSSGGGLGRISTKAMDTINFSDETLDLSCVEQIVEISQTRAIADAMQYAVDHVMKGRVSLSSVLDRIDDSMDKMGLDCLVPLLGTYARPRRYEIGCAINRFRRAKFER